MRNIAALACALACLTAPAFAQTRPSPTGGVPNPITGVPNPVSPFGVAPSNRYAPQAGGYTTYGPNGSITRVTRNYDGGYTVYGPYGITRLTPNADGGYTIYGNGHYGAPCFFPGYGWYPCAR